VVTARKISLKKRLKQSKYMRDFRLPPRSRWELHSYGLLYSE